MPHEGVRRPGHEAEADRDATAPAPRRSQRGPADISPVADSVSPRDPSARVRATGDPLPPQARSIHPPAVVERRPAPVVVADPRIVAVVGPVTGADVRSEIVDRRPTATGPTPCRSWDRQSTLRTARGSSESPRARTGRCPHSRPRRRLGHRPRRRPRRLRRAAPTARVLRRAESPAKRPAARLVGERLAAKREEAGGRAASAGGV